jgi:Lecithin:cholesterol acyltransferase
MTNSKKKDSKSDDNKNKSSGDSTGSNNGKWMALSIAIGAVAIAYAVHEHNLLSEAMSSFNTSGYSLSINDAFNGTALSLAPFEEFFDGYFGEDSKFHTEWEKIQQKISISSESFKPLVGQRMAEEGYKAKHPVFMVPGFVTSGLELWSGEECAEGFFRRKIWGSLETFRSFIRDYDCWKRHLSLDPKTGLDPDGIRIRNSQGFEAADFWTSAFWVWDRIIQNLAEIGYDGTSMSMEAYDWRMDYKLLEKRDGHFTKLKKKIEAFVESADGTKAVIMGHSMVGAANDIIRWIKFSSSPQLFLNFREVLTSFSSWCG